MPFINIFSKTKEKKPKEKPKQTIIIDKREKSSLVPSELSSLGNKIEFRHLPVADYLIDNTAIERKTLSDFKSSIVNKRIMQQLLELKQFPSYLLILEGNLKEIETENRIHPNAFRGFLLSVALEYQVPIIFTQNEEETSKYLSVLAKKSKKTNLPIRASKIFKTKKEQTQFILEGFPNIGPATIKKLLKKFKTIKNIINAPEKELKETIGKKAESIIKFLN
jgi:Fanconi anemia group M protein